MKVLLVHASISSCGFNSYGRGDLTESSWINHGLASISAYLKAKGHKVLLLDLRLLSGWEEFKDGVKKFSPEIAGISMMSVDFNPVMECVSRLKEVNPSLIVTVGGPHPTIAPEEVLENKLIDHIITGEGELSFADLIEGLSLGKKQERLIKGRTPDLDSLPFVDRELYSVKEEPVPLDLPRPFVTIIAGRGCLYNCSFCQPAEKKIFGDKVRRRSVANVISELKTLRFKSMLIHDDCLTEDKQWINDFCREYEAAGFKQPFVCQSRADIICRSEEMVKNMRRAGLFCFIIGFESGSQRILNLLRKGTKIEHNINAAKLCRKYGIRVWANYMLGIPTETKEETLETVKMLHEIRPDYYSPAFFTPHPGSDLFDKCVKEGLSLVSSHDEYRRNPFGAKVKGIDYAFLQDALKESMKYRKERFLDKVLRQSLVKAAKNRIKRTRVGQMLVTRIKGFFRY